MRDGHPGAFLASGGGAASRPLADEVVSVFDEVPGQPSTSRNVSKYFGATWFDSGQLW